MTQQEQQTMELLLDLFEHKGWSIFIKEQEELATYLKEQAYIECNTNDEWQQRRGMLLTLDRILSYTDTTKYVYEQHETESDV